MDDLQCHENCGINGEVFVEIDLCSLMVYEISVKLLIKDKISLNGINRI